MSRELTAYKRASARARLVSVSTTSVHPCEGRWSWPGALVEMTGVGGPPLGGAWASVDHNSRGIKE